jgi:hypothetical protein
MKYICEYNKFLILEKRIDQISTNIDIIFSFDIIKTKHADERRDFKERGLPGDIQDHISNADMSDLINLFKREISRAIIDEEIVDQTEFVIRSLDLNLSMGVVANKITSTYWKLIITTVFRESDENSLRVGKDQLVFEE